MSWVFMVGERVYKLKKPVRFAYLDFYTLDPREAACRAEFQLNRRLAPDVYLDVVPLTISTSGLAISGEGSVVDWLVVMRRLHERQTLEAALSGTWLKAPQVDRIVLALRSFYTHAPRVQLDPERYVFEWQTAISDNLRVLLSARFGLPAGSVERITQAQYRFLAKRSNLLRERIRERWYVDAHGDLRPGHIWLRAPLTIIDCLEFNPKPSIPSMKSPFFTWNANASAVLGLANGSGGIWPVH
jgi:aminoglycoside phosphotransferase family enzyme